MSWQLLEKTGNVAVFTDGRYRMRMQAYGRDIMRVTQTGADSFMLNDYPMVSAAAPDSPLDVSSDAASARIACGGIYALLNMETGALGWFGADDTPLMREPEKHGRTLRGIDIIRNDFDADTPMVEYQSVDGMKARAVGRPRVDRKGYQTRLSFVFDDDEDIFGLGQHEEGILNYRGQHQFLYQHNLKIAAPVIFSSKGWALFNNNCSAQIFHDDAFGSYISADAADEMDYFVMYGPEFDDIIAHIRFLTGDVPMLPRWALGYVQSKEHYASGQELIDIASEYRRRGVPLDCVVQDWQSWPEGCWGQKTPDKERYPDLKATIDALHAMNVHIMWSIWPNIGGGANREEMLEKGYMLGNRNTYDAFNPDARAIYWAQCNEELFPAGMDSWWCDCSEPFESDWYGDVKMFPEDRMYCNVNEAKQYIDPTQILAYSLNHSRALYEGQRAVTNDKRVVNLTRSGLTGQQRYSTICWNGDTSATWETLQKTIPDGLNFMLSGIPYWTVDAGAFFVKKWRQWFGYGEYEQGCKDDNYRELYLRWMQLSAFLPMMRSHGADTPREIWNFGEPGETYYEAIADTIRLRYMLIPYTYSVMAGVHFERSTLMRMLAFDFRGDKIARNISDQFMFGPSLMICPVVTPAHDGTAERDVYLPAGCAWYDFWTNLRYEGGQWLHLSVPLSGIPVFVREGSMVVVGPDIQYADEVPCCDPLTLYVYSGADARFTLYNDAGDGYAYENGEFLRKTYIWNDAAQQMEQTVSGDGRFDTVDPRIVVI